MIFWQSINKSSAHIITLLMMVLAYLAQQHLGSEVFKDGGNRCLFSSQNAADCSHIGLFNIPNDLPWYLEYLDLSNNNITELTNGDFKYLTKLRNLKLNNNRITTIRGPIFSRLRNLEYLDLSSNNISILHNEVFSRLTNLQTLLLNKNEIIFIKRNAFKDLSSLKKMYIDSKELHCSCETLWFSKWLKKQQEKMLNSGSCDFEQVTCYDQRSQKFFRLTELNDARFNCHWRSELRRKRRGNQVTFSHWSCGVQASGSSTKLKVVPLTEVSPSSSSLEHCMNLCDAAGYFYGALSGSSCLCGDVKSSSYNAGSGCKVDCKGGTPATCFPHIPTTSLTAVQAYLASLNHVVTTSSVAKAVSSTASSISSQSSNMARFTTSQQNLYQSSLHPSNTLQSLSLTISSKSASSFPEISLESLQTTATSIPVIKSHSFASILETETSGSSSFVLEMRPSNMLEVKSTSTAHESNSESVASAILSFTATTSSAVQPANTTSIQTASASSFKSTSTPQESNSESVASVILSLTATTPSVVQPANTSIQTASASSFKSTSTTQEFNSENVASDILSLTATTPSVVQPANTSIQTASASSFKSTSTPQEFNSENVASDILSLTATTSSVVQPANTSMQTVSVSSFGLSSFLLLENVYTSFVQPSTTSEIISSSEPLIKSLNSKALVFISSAIEATKKLDSMPSIMTPIIQSSIPEKSLKSFNTVTSEIKTVQKFHTVTSEPETTAPETIMESPVLVSKREFVEELSSVLEKISNTTTKPTNINSTMPAYFSSERVRSSFASIKMFSSETAPMKSILASQNFSHTISVTPSVTTEAVVADFKTSFDPVKSLSTQAILMTKITDETPYVFEGHRSTREIKSAASLTGLKNSVSTLALSERGFKIVTTDDSNSALSTVSVSFCYTEGGNQYCILYQKIEETLQIQELGIDLVDQNSSAALPAGIPIDIHVIVHSGNKDSFSAFLSYEGINQSSLMFKCKDVNTTFCTTNQSRASVFLANFTGDTFKSVSIVIQGSDTLSATISVNLTVLEIIKYTPELISASNAYIATSESTLSAFKTTYNLVQATWKILDEQNNIIYQNYSVCTTSCPTSLSRTSGCMTTSSDTCFLSQEYEIKSPGYYRSTVTFSNHVTKAPVVKTYSFNVETRITSLSIASCDYSANVNETKSFTAIYKGSNVTIIWYLDGVAQKRNSDTFIYIFMGIGTYNVSVFVNNNINNATASRVITALKTGSIHGLSIINQSVVYYPTNVQLTLGVRLCEGHNPELDWDFGDGSNVTTSSKIIKHMFINPQTYKIRVVAKNSIGKTEEATMNLTLQDEIKNFTAFSSNSIVKVNEKFNIFVDISSGTDVIFAVNHKRKPKVSISFSNNKSADLSISTARTVSYLVSAANRVSKTEKPIVVTAQEIISFFLEKYYYSPMGRSMSFTAKRVTGSDVFTRWNFGDHFQTAWVYVNKASPSVQHVYQNEGSYSLSQNSTNNVSSLFLSSTVFVQRPLDNDKNKFTVTANRYVATNESLRITITVNQTSIYGYNVSGAASFLLMNNSRSIIKVFDTARSNQLTFYAKNQVSNASKTILIDSQDRITGKVEVSPIYVSLNTSQILIATVTGSAPGFNWLFENGHFLKGKQVNQTFSVLGPSMINITAKNEISEATSSLIINVELPIYNLTLSANASVIPIGSSVELRASVQYRPEHIYYWTVSNKGVNKSSDTLIWTFSTLGFHTVNVNLQNHIGTGMASTVIEVQEPIVGAQFTIISNYSSEFLLFNKTTTFSANVTSGSNISYSWKSDYLRDVINGLASFQMLVSHPDVRYVTVTLKASNKISKSEISRKFPVIQRGQDVAIVANTTATSPNQTVSLWVVLTSGSNLSVTWQIDGNLVASGMKLDYTFKNVAKYNVSVTVANVISSQHTSLVIVVQDRISLIRMHPVVAATNKSSEFRVSVHQGTDPEYQWNLPPGVVSLNKSPLLSRQNLIFLHPGIYHLPINVKNRVDNINASFEITVQNEISGVEITHNQTFYPTLKFVYFQAYVTEGSNVTYDWSFRLKDFSHEYKNHKGVSHMFSRPGVYDVVVNATNRVSKMRKSIKVSIQDVAIISSIISPYGNVLPAHESISFKALVNGTNVTVNFAVNESVRNLPTVHSMYRFVATKLGPLKITVTARNDVSFASKSSEFLVQERVKGLSLWASSLFVAAGCSVRFRALVAAGTSVAFKWYINETLTNKEGVDFKYIFSNKGSFRVNVTAKNSLPFKSLVSSVVVVVEEASCPPPTVGIIGGKQREVLQYHWLYTEALVDHNCSTSSVSSAWSFKIADEKTDCLPMLNSLQSFNFSTIIASEISLDTPLLSILPGALPLGHYCMIYTAAFGKDGKFTIIDAVNLKVISVPPNPVILGGASRTVGVEQSFHLQVSSAISNNLPSNLLYQWTCLVKPRNASVIIASPGCRNITWNAENKTLVRAGSLEVQTSYQFLLSVKMPRGVLVNRMQTISVVAGKVAEVLVQCITCKIYKSLKYVHQRVLKLLGKCQNCLASGLPLTMNFKWRITASNGSVIQYHERNSTEETNALIIKENTFDGLNVYEIALTVDVFGDSFTKGESTLSLSPNRPPANGSCDFTPETGETLKTYFNYSCKGWKDEDNVKVPFIYWLIVINADSSHDILYRGIKARRSFYLPVGDKNKNRELQIQILVEDILGSVTVGLQKRVFVHPPVVNNIGKFLEDNVLRSLPLLAQQKDINQVVTASQSTVKLLGEASSISAKEQAIISNVTSYTSKMSTSSLESIEQLSATLKMSMSLMPETSVARNTRQDLTASLENMIEKVKIWAERGQLGSDTSLKSLLFLAQNNIAADVAVSTTGTQRKRRAASSSISGLKANLNLVMRLYTSILRGSLRGEDAKRYSTKYGTAVLRRSSSISLSKVVMADGCSFELGDSFIQSSDVFQIFNTSFKNSHSQLPGISSSVAGLSYSKPDGTEIQVKDLPSNKSIVVKLNSTRYTTYSLLINLIHPNSFIEGELAISIPIDNSSLLRVDILVNSSPKDNIDVFLRPGRMPTDEDTLYRLNQSSHGKISRVFMPREFSALEKHFIRIKNRDKEQALNISIIIYTVSCRFWNRKKQIWDTFGCEPLVKSDLQCTVCRCNHLTSFASALKIAPNPIKWSTIAELDIEKNPIAVATCLALVVIFLVSLFFASRKDEEDRREAQFIPLLGSDDYFKYEIRIKTGIYPGAGTTANVGIKIYGTKCTTKSIVLTKEDGLQRNSIDLFRFSSPSRLGQITSVRVWHNNQGNSPSWYLSRIVIKNLLSGQKFFFFCNRWLAVDRGDGQIERQFDVADQKTMAQFTTIFNDVVGRTFTDYHLWISLFEKPRLSRFTRVQRVTCCVTFLLSWMCVDAMWFGTLQDGKIDLYLGFKGYSYEEILVGVISSLMVFPVNMIFVLIFRKCRIPQSRQIVDGEEEVTIHMLPRQRRSRRLSEDWIEIEDNRPSGPPKLGTSLPRCGGVPRLNSYQPMVAVDELSNQDHLIDLEEEDDELQETAPDTCFSQAIFPARQSKQRTYRLASDVCAEEPTNLPRFPRYSTKQYTKIHFPSLQEEDEDRRELLTEQESPEHKPILLNRFSREEDKRNLSYSERQMGSIITELKSRSANNNDFIGSQISQIQDYNDSFSSKQSSHLTSSSLTRTFSEPQSRQQRYRPGNGQQSFEIPDIREFHSSLECLLPSWCTILAYLGCLAVSLLSFVIILIYGQQFGKKKAISWIASLFSGLFQDIFITYPVLLVIVATVIALVRKPMNLDYSDFVVCPVVPGDSNVTAKPVRGYALEIAQRQGRNRRKLKKLLKNTAFQFVHLWMIFSICLTSYKSNMAAFKDNLMSQLDSKKSGFSSVKSIEQLWLWTEHSLPQFLYENKMDHADWILRSVPRLRQIRVRSSNCTKVRSPLEIVTKDFTCKPDLATDNQETRDFAGSWNVVRPSRNNPWAYVAKHELNGSNFFGEFTVYPHSGYVVYLSSKNPSHSRAQIRSLKAAGWLDVKSRAVFIEFTMQNFNVNKFAVMTILFEISATGSILSNFDILYTRIHMYTRRIDYFRLFCEVIFGLIAFYHVWLLMERILKHQLRLFCKFWDVHLMFTCAVSVTVVALYIYRLVIFLKLTPHVKTGIPQGYDIRHEAIIDWAIQTNMAFLCFLAIVKIVTLLSLTRSYIVVGATLRKSSRHIFTLLIALAIVLCAFSSWGYLAFGSESYIFHSFWRSMVYTFLIRGWKATEAEVREDHLAAWNILYVTVLIAFVFPFFKAMLCASYKDGKLKFLENRTRKQREFTDYLFKVITRRKKTQKKRVKFSVNPSTRRNTLAASQQTISLGSDPGFPGHMSWSYSRMPRLHRERLLNRLNPRTDEILAHVYQLEQDEFLEDEFYSRLETMAKEVEMSDEQF